MRCQGEQQTHLVSCLAHGQGTGDLSSTSSVHDTVVADEVADDTQCIMKGPFGLLYDLQGQTVALSCVRRQVGAWQLRITEAGPGSLNFTLG